MCSIFETFLWGGHFLVKFEKSQFFLWFLRIWVSKSAKTSISPNREYFVLDHHENTSNMCLGKKQASNMHFNVYLKVARATAKDRWYLSAEDSGAVKAQNREILKQIYKEILCENIYSEILVKLFSLIWKFCIKLFSKILCIFHY